MCTRSLEAEIPLTILCLRFCNSDLSVSPSECEPFSTPDVSAFVIGADGTPGLVNEPKDKDLI